MKLGESTSVRGGMVQTDERNGLHFIPVMDYRPIGLYSYRSVFNIHIYYIGI